MTDVQVKIELGHKAVPRAKPTKEGFTHDWVVYVRGPEQYNISNFVEKVVFNLHPSFENPKRVCKEPPYQVDEHGYAGFELPIEICFKSKAEPRKVRIPYNLFLNMQDPVNHSRCEKLTFQNPTEEFKKKLLKGGGWQMMPQEDKQFENLFGTPIKTTDSPKKAKQSSSASAVRKEKEREREIERAKEREKEIERAKEKEREREKERKKEKERILKERKEREISKLDKSAKKSEKYKSSESEERKEISPISNIKKEKDKSPEETKHRSEKVKPGSGESRKSISPKENTSKDEQKEKRKSSDSYRVKETVKVKAEKPSEPISTKIPERKNLEKKHSKLSEHGKKAVVQKHKQLSKITSRELIDDLSLSDDSDSSEVSSLSSSTATTVGRSRSASPAASDSESEPETKGSPSPAPSSNVSPAPSPQTETPLGKLMANLPSEESDEEIQERGSKSFTNPAASRSSLHGNTPRKKSSADGKQEGQVWKNGVDTLVSEQTLPFNKYVKRQAKRDLPQLDNSKDRGGQTLKHTDSSGFGTENTRKRRNDSTLNNGYDVPIDVFESPDSEDLMELVELQRKLMTITDPNVLVKIVQVIKQVGKFKIVDSSFDFDLCTLDSSTVQKIKASLSQC